MRLKTTYFICELDFGPGSAARGCCSSHDLFAAIKRLYCELYGDSGWGRAGAMLAVKNVDASTRLCIIRSATECRGDVHACLALLKAVGGAPVAGAPHPSPKRRWRLVGSHHAARSLPLLLLPLPHRPLSVRAFHHVDDPDAAGGVCKPALAGDGAAVRRGGWRGAAYVLGDA